MRTRTNYGEGPVGSIGDESGLTAVEITCTHPKTRVEYTADKIDMGSK